MTETPLHIQLNRTRSALALIGLDNAETIDPLENDLNVRDAAFEIEQLIDAADVELKAYEKSGVVMPAEAAERRKKNLMRRIEIRAALMAFESLRKLDQSDGE